MKKYLLIILAALGACQDENPQPAEPDPFIGSWHYIDSYANVELEISFDVISSKDGEYVVKNVRVKYEDVPEDAALEMETHDKFADNDGFGKIQIHGGWSFPTHDDWIFITLYYNSIYKKSLSYVMDADEVRITMMNSGDPIILKDQVFTRIE